MKKRGERCAERRDKKSLSNIESTECSNRILFKIKYIYFYSMKCVSIQTKFRTEFICIRKIKNAPKLVLVHPST